MPRVASPFFGGYNDPSIGGAAVDVASILMGGEGPNARAAREAEIEYRNALTEDARARAREATLKGDALERARRARETVADRLRMGVDVRDPNARAPLGADMLHLGDDLKNLAPAFLLGLGGPADETASAWLSTVFGNPLNINESATTPGADRIRKQETDRALAVQALQNQGAMDRERLKAEQPAGAKTPLDVSPGDAKALEALLMGAYGIEPEGGMAQVDPNAWSKIVSEANARYQQNRNAGLAVEATRGAMPLTAYDPQEDAGFLWFDGDPVLRTLANAGAAPGAATPAQGAVPPPAQRQVGAVYDTPRGQMKWTGTGWLPAN